MLNTYVDYSEGYVLTVSCHVGINRSYIMRV